MEGREMRHQRNQGEGQHKKHMQPDDVTIIVGVTRTNDFLLIIAKPIRTVITTIIIKIMMIMQISMTMVIISMIIAN